MRRQFSNQLFLSMSCICHCCANLLGTVLRNNFCACICSFTFFENTEPIFLICCDDHLLLNEYTESKSTPSARTVLYLTVFEIKVEWCVSSIIQYMHIKDMYTALVKQLNQQQITQYYLNCYVGSYYKTKYRMGHSYYIATFENITRFYKYTECRRRRKWNVF